MDLNSTAQDNRQTASAYDPVVIPLLYLSAQPQTLPDRNLIVVCAYQPTQSLLPFHWHQSP